MKRKNRISVDDFISAHPSGLFTFKDTSELEPLDTIIGQRRAIEAIDFGLNMKGPEYNIFVTGLEGTGKSSIVKELLEHHAKSMETPEDLCLVNNFEDAYCPVVIEMPAGSAVYFSRNMKQFIETIKTKIPDLIETSEFQQEQSVIQDEVALKHKKLFETLDHLAAEKGLSILRQENDYQVVPVMDGQPVSMETFEALPENQKQQIEQQAQIIEKELSEALIKTAKLSEEMNKQIRAVVTAKTEQLISDQIDPLRYYFKECTDIQTHLKKLREDIIDNIALFLGTQGNPEDDTRKIQAMTQSLATRYQVNVLVDRRHESGAPVVFEPNPSFQNLFGKIEKKPVMGSVETNFTLVQAGSLLKANKGYLIINIEPLLLNPPVWEALKRALQDSMLQIEDMPDQADYGMPSLKPAPIPLTVKVVLVGGYEPFSLLQSTDSRFNKIFRVRADFDYETDLNNENLAYYARFIARVCQRENLRDFSPDGVWAVIEYASRAVSDQRRLSLRFGQILGVLKEADFWAKKTNSPLVSEDHVNRAINQHRFRNNLYEEKVMAEFDDQFVLIDVKGKVVGQVNALAVYDMGEIAFGRPSRITAESYMGTPGIINVEHEAELSGQTHDKGVMIVSGYLGRIFAQHYPLSVTISITFEQSYDGIDGDSASSTELYAVLSSLSNLPIRQEIAVTGSVNQKGKIQAIGGVNEKIEGFYDICVRKGLTGKQGVIIPASNVKNLILRRDVVKAIAQKKFHLYKISTIEEGIEILTGIKAGKADSNGLYPKNTVFGCVQKKLKQYHELSLSFGQ